METPTHLNYGRWVSKRVDNKVWLAQLIRLYFHIARDFGMDVAKIQVDARWREDGVNWMMDLHFDESLSEDDQVTAYGCTAVLWDWEVTLKYDILDLDLHTIEDAPCLKELVHVAKADYFSNEGQTIEYGSPEHDALGIEVRDDLGITPDNMLNLSEEQKIVFAYEMVKRGLKIPGDTECACGQYHDPQEIPTSFDKSLN